MTSPLRRPRVVATDLDGTLLRSDGTVSARTREVLEALDAAGTQVVFVTARPPRWLAEVGRLVGGHGVIICLGGACVYDVGTRQVVESRGFALPALRDVVRDLRAAVPGVSLAVEQVDGPVFDATFRHDEDMPDSWRGPVERALDAPVAKLLARAEALGQDELFEQVLDVVGDRALLAFSGAAGLAELLPPDVTKAGALAAWSASHGIGAHEVWAFGDMPNDLPMLNWAGTSYAVANAHPEVLTAATHVTASNDEDGVAVALERLLDGAGSTTTTSMSPERSGG
ncbi:HAD-IIB family hydrolase [Oerskovia turbata]|uniref:HAD-IIB family hydrolase n=1 Tax=Oerskovia turbata TaxID=1713 RepID=A0A4Q1KQV1_9CELL|nr:HAD-IIB family hydrolase [Oerskovia turbata]RXR27490.1 HAD-IIB family hydrolase [Oerskovia turbata]RXR32282.1 HAD-IIB family hydrolase [Oerskovia turbata]TGJ95119.1 HAD-IIB family hydrolase [Actinotalea fermentans ATCC 43279 = JCM 9966 = DSM 3133]